MKKVTLELIVGIFVAIGILCLGWLSVKLGKMELVGGDHYEVYAEFDSVSGLKEGAAVEIAGVEIGRVDRIALDPKFNDRARVSMRIANGVKLQDDIIASVRTSGIIGDKFILLKPGGSDKFLANNGRIRETESAVDLEELLSKYIHGKVE
ncbi:outer membrane lipid asymmetry maintenance protein MlaD [Geobacter hydrogenophilus]|uniref:Outer membrane lipid asymmetry maintenance protein MlaD n=1 Tax=Geobacter hydrogenophilus TaxID=40983 RepID=A0A9W6G406_9BACT|nr:outer membrane lipid asymmetry maintenance protein MlaD [Geobacter hydrogenophilus]MBT0892703.1 outer membrane lipid asymmetry maintenance protein MlaD [Geobacter hydrogenophilus]GLI40101.1 outer membrane lipid asymmetry maintenance protein MlaD [Geobacter hydrogenophilus]